MNSEELFAKISAHMVKGIMFHAQMADYYDFLGLRGYKRMHEYHYFEESMMFRALHRYYINNYCKLISELVSENPHSIPENWLRYSREEVDNNTKRNAIKTAFSQWVEWENGTLKMYEKAYCELMDIDDIATALFVKNLIQKVQKELKYARRKQLDIKSIDYDMSIIVSKQTEIHDCYKEKLEHLCFDFEQQE